MLMATEENEAALIRRAPCEVAAERVGAGRVTCLKRGESQNNPLRLSHSDGHQLKVNTSPVKSLKNNEKNTPSGGLEEKKTIIHNTSKEGGKTFCSLVSKEQGGGKRIPRSNNWKQI
ncbi:hypothetical protein TNCV_2537401 [Trichonephila clavipes]|nr:hypothetical protein TNCV_2537401 [Trichonephila clavipes]